SLAGNLMLMVHSIIQEQFHVCIVQACNSVISWRNLNLMESEDKRWRFQTVAMILITSVSLATSTFILQGYLFSNGNVELFRIPIFLGIKNEAEDLRNAWHYFGFIGIILFNSRFWVQWWFAEKFKTSYLGVSFWWISLVGDIICLCYFL